MAACYVKLITEEFTLIRQKLAHREPVSEGGETGSRGHLSVQIALSPRPHEASPSVGLRDGHQGSIRCPRL